MSDRSKTPDSPTLTTTRRSFVGGVGAVVLGCASDDGTTPQQTSAMEQPGGSATPGTPGAMNPAGEGTGSEPMGAAAESGDQAAQPTQLQNDGNPQGGGNPQGNGNPQAGGNPPSNPEAPTAPTTPPAAQPGTCTLYPEQTEGPYYVDGDMVRADIREGKPGTLFTLDLLVLSANGCTPLANAAVDIWHCDAGGIYSGYQGQLGGLDTRGLVFLRGTQVTGADGRVQFQTIYPGWYPGRTTHIHFKVHLPGNREATSQLYFDEALNREVYGTDPYAVHGQKDTSNQADAFARGAPLLPVVRSGAGYAGTMTLTVAG